MMGCTFKDQSTVGHQNRQPGLSLGFFRVKTLTSCAVGGLSDVRKMHGQGEWRLALGEQSRDNYQNTYVGISAIFSARRHGTGQFDVAMKSAAQEILGGQDRAQPVLDKHRVAKEAHRSRFCVPGGHVS